MAPLPLTLYATGQWPSGHGASDIVEMATTYNCGGQYVQWATSGWCRQCGRYNGQITSL